MLDMLVRQHIAQNPSGAGELQNRSFTQPRPLMGAAHVRVECSSENMGCLTVIIVASPPARRHAATITLEAVLNGGRWKGGR